MGNSRYVGVIFNFIGASARWFWGFIWRTILKKQKFTFKEYLNGPNELSYYDNMCHASNNGIIGVLVFVFLIVPLIKLILN